MITLDSLRSALISAQPWTELDRLVQAEQSLGRRVKDIQAELEALVEPVRDAIRLTEDADDALMDTLDALAGNCAPKWRYKDPPNYTPLTEQEIAKLPAWARVAFAARCARRMLPLFRHDWRDAPLIQYRGVARAVEYAERAASIAHGVDPDTITGGTSPFGDARTAAEAAQGSAAPIAAAVAHIAATSSVTTPSQIALSASVSDTTAVAVLSHEVLSSVFPETVLAIRRDFDHLAPLAEWQHWTDDTPVPPEVFGPLWPEVPPPGWPADPEVPQRADLPLEILSRARDLDRMTEDDVVNVFNAINAYYIARTGVRLTMDDLRPLLTAAVPAEV